jgi:hypothetical protein
MVWESIKQCIKTPILKHTKGYDRIPQRILIDESAHLIHHLSNLFSMIYVQKKTTWIMESGKNSPNFKKVRVM